MMTTDTPEQIQMCLHCKYKECINCLEGKDHGKTEKRHEEWTVRIRELTRLGYSDRQIARKMGLSPKTVWTIRHAAGIPSKTVYAYDRSKSYI